MAVSALLSLDNVVRVVQGGVILGVFYTVAVTIYRLFFSPLAKIPGPWLTRISPIPEANALKRQQRTDWIKSLFDENPGAVAIRTGPNSVSFNHPDAIKAIYGTSDPHELVRIIVL
jgi:benzoate 4-monooxygenase